MATIRQSTSLTLLLWVWLQPGKVLQAQPQTPTNPPGWSEVCGGIRIATPPSIRFTAIERQLLCGDPTTPAWQDVPPTQAQYFLKTFLQSRGYLQPEIKQDAHGIWVTPGASITFATITIAGSPSSVITDGFKRRFQGEPITPEVLNAAEAWLTTQLDLSGRPCAQVSLTADVATRQLQATIKNRGQATISAINQEPINGLNPKALQRFHSMTAGDPYNAQAVALATRRILASGSVASAFFTKNCQPPDASAPQAPSLSLHQYATVGPPIGVGIGFGANSEDGPLARLSYKNSRRDAMGSQFNTILRASRQKASLTANWLDYYWQDAPRLYSNPYGSIAYTDQTQLASQQATIGLWLGYTWELQAAQLSGKSGPAFHLDRDLSNPEILEHRYLAWETTLSLMDYRFEYYQDAPRAGGHHNLTWTLVPAFATTGFHGNQMTLAGQQLFNIGGFDPPVLVSGWRYGLAALFPDADTNVTALPTRMRQFLGGQKSIRGFAPDSLPSQVFGACRSAYLGWEGRLPLAFAPDWQPLVFWDFASVAASCLESLNGLPVFHSPGLGLRWQSLLGPLRLSIARGYVLKDQDGIGEAAGAGKLVAFFSLGEEF